MSYDIPFITSVFPKFQIRFYQPSIRNPAIGRSGKRSRGNIRAATRIQILRLGFVMIFAKNK